MNLGLISLGCAKNLVDSEHILGMFIDSDIKIESDPKKCDVIIINTCGFIESAKKEAIDTILEMAEYKAHRLKKLIVCGCLSQRYKDELIKEIPEVDAFIKIDDYDRLDKIFKELLKEEKIKRFKDTRELVTPKYFAYLKISDGCDNRCAYCAIPLIRGNCKSYRIEDLYQEALELYKKGVRELCVIAQDTTYYGHDLYGEFKLAELLKELDKIPFEWIRVLYMYPDEITDELLYTMKQAKHVIPYFDIPIQHGNDEMLRLMNRRGSVKLIKERIAMIRELFEEPIIRTTLITGFPHETEKTFTDTLDLVKEIGFDSLGAFTYSKEEGTKAYDMTEEVEPELALRRYETLMQLQSQIVGELNEKKVGKILKVLVEKKEELFDRYIGRSIYSAPDDVDGKVYIKTKEALEIGSFYDCIVENTDTYDLYAKLKEE